MKKIRVLFLFVFIPFAAFFASCDKGATYPLAPELSADINNVNWATSGVALNASGNQITIKAANPAGGGLVINMPAGITAGTYSLSQTSNCNAIYTSILNSAVNNFYSVSGTLVIAISPPGQFEGSFSFTAVNILVPSTKVNVTNGIFSLNND